MQYEKARAKRNIEKEEQEKTKRQRGVKTTSKVLRLQEKILSQAATQSSRVIRTQ